MLRSLFLWRVARRHIGQVALVGNGRYGVILEAGPLGICVRDHDGDRLHLPWQAVPALIFGEGIERGFQRAVAIGISRRAAEACPKPERKALTDDEIAAAAREDAAATIGTATIIALGSGLP